MPILFQAGVVVVAVVVVVVAVVVVVKCEGKLGCYRQGAATLLSWDHPRFARVSPRLEPPA